MKIVFRLFLHIYVVSKSVLCHFCFKLRCACVHRMGCSGFRVFLHVHIYTLMCILHIHDLYLIEHLSIHVLHTYVWACVFIQMLSCISVRSIHSYSMLMHFRVIRIFVYWSIHCVVCFHYYFYICVYMCMHYINVCIHSFLYPYTY